MKRPVSINLVPLLGVLVAIGCGSGRSESAPVGEQHSEAAPAKQLAQADPEQAHASATSGGATIQGSVKFTGPTPSSERVKMDADPQCQLQHKEPVTKQDVVVNANGTLQHVFVYVKEGLQGQTFPAPEQPAVLDQQGCMYHPHVLGVRVNQPLQIVNSDSTLHNVNCKPTKSKPFNIAQPTKGMKSTKQFTAPEVMVKCACNVHPWMANYIGVLDHPFFSVTNDQGVFSISGLPAGQYTIEAWHEKFGAKTQQVTVGQGEARDVSFEFSGQ